MADHLGLDWIVPNPDNRKDMGDLRELADSIRVNGVLQAVTVIRHPERRGYWMLVCGERRWRAARMAGLDDIPVERREPMSRPQVLAAMLVENWQRENMNPMDKAEMLGRLRDCGLSPAMIATKTGLSASTVSYHLSLLLLDGPTRERVRAGDVKAGDAHKAIASHRAMERFAASAAKGSGRARRNGAPAAEARKRVRPKLVSVEEDPFSYRHPLADEASLRCQLAGHSSVLRVGRARSKAEGRVACGACWEFVIREDQKRLDYEDEYGTGRLAGVTAGEPVTGVPFKAEGRRA